MSEFKRGDWVYVTGHADQRHHVLGVDGPYMAIECSNGVNIIAARAATMAPQHDISDTPVAQIRDTQEF